MPALESCHGNCLQGDSIHEVAGAEPLQSQDILGTMHMVGSIDHMPGTALIG